MGKLALFGYEILWRMILGLAKLLAPFHKELAAQLSIREELIPLLPKWDLIRSRYPKGVIFVCSSAGEYEQAKPLIRRIERQGGTAIFILFFSPSGYKFAKSQKETLPFGLISSDRPSFWKTVTAHLRPTAMIFVRYELWPGMVHVSKHFAPLYLVDGVESPNLRKKKLARILRSSLIRPMKRSFLVNVSDQEFFQDVLELEADSLRVVGDTKYDRVLERIEERSGALEILRGSLQSFLKGRRIIVIGSAWTRDLQEFMSIYSQLREFEPTLGVIVAPHDLSRENVATFVDMLRSHKACRVSTDTYQAANAADDFLLVDVLGDLPELYGCAHLAWVGGAMHFRVHNVLEPACRGIYLCFGALFQTSQEAKSLVNQGLARVIHNGHEFFQWYKNLTWDSEPPHQSLWQAVVAQKGASDLIISEISATWHE